jgi:hypothetical protein
LQQLKKGEVNPHKTPSLEEPSPAVTERKGKKPGGIKESIHSGFRVSKITHPHEKKGLFLSCYSCCWNKPTSFSIERMAAFVLRNQVSTD